MFNNTSIEELSKAAKTLKEILFEDLPKIFDFINVETLTICCVPRAKANYNSNQLLFYSMVALVANKLDRFIDGTQLIKRLQMLRQLI